MIARFRSIILIIIIALLVTPVLGQTIKIKQDGNEKWLVDQNDFTLYYLLSDGGNEISTCYEGCLDNWKPYENVIDVSSNLRKDDFGKISRRDGTSQIMYKGWPLYTYYPDRKAGDKLGVGGLWDIINPDRFPPY